MISIVNVMRHLRTMLITPTYFTRCVLVTYS